MSLRLGLAGLGVHGQRYANHLLCGDVSGARLTAVSRGDATAGESFAKEHGLIYADSYESLLALPEIDAAILVLPPDVQAQAACACLERNIPVLVEKPLAHDAVTARHVESMATSSGTPLMVAHTLRFDPLIQALARQIESLEPLRLLSLNQRFEPSERPWIDRPGPGGVLLNTAVHGFDLLRYLTGREPVAIVAEVARGATEQTEDQVVALVRLEPGRVLATLDNSRSTRSRSGRIEIVGDSGQVWGDHIHRTLERVSERGRVTLGPIEASPTIPLTLASFVRAVGNGSAPEVTARDGRIALELVQAARHSIREQRWVELQEI